MNQSFIMSPKVDFAFKLLFGDEKNKDAHDPIIEWLQFLDAKSEEVMEMLAEKNEGIEKAYRVLKCVSQDDVARMAYEAREAEIRDQLTREKVAREEGEEAGVCRVAKRMLSKGSTEEYVAEMTDLTVEEVRKIKASL
ncbi:MAG: Rpn family recombination-promoting nuclease/putative transposase [Cellulosilyticaceae bacterium]